MVLGYLPAAVSGHCDPEAAAAAEEEAAEAAAFLKGLTPEHAASLREEASSNVSSPSTMGIADRISAQLKVGFRPSRLQLPPAPACTPPLFRHKRLSQTWLRTASGASGVSLQCCPLTKLACMNIVLHVLS